MKVTATTTEPLKRVPYNTQRLYVMGTTIDGCEIYMPVYIHKLKNKNVELILTNAKTNLQDWLDTQYEKSESLNSNNPFDPPPNDIV